MNQEIDSLDLKILAILMDDAKTAYIEIAKRLFVSGGTVHVRMKKLEQLGVVKRHQIVVDYSKLGYDITAFIGIYLSQSSYYDEVAKRLDEIAEIVGVHYTTGNYSIFSKIVCKDTNHLRHVLHDKIQRINGVQRTETLISLEESTNRPIKLEELEGLDIAK